MAPHGRKAFGLAFRAASLGNGSQIRSGSCRGLHNRSIQAPPPLHSFPSSRFLSCLSEKRHVPDYRFAPIRSSFLIVSSQQRFAHHRFAPFPARALIVSYDCPLFLSSSSSLLLQSTTPFYCPRDVCLDSLSRSNTFVSYDSRPRLANNSFDLLHYQKEAKGKDTVTFVSTSGSSVCKQSDSVKRGESVQQLVFSTKNEVFNGPNAISFGRLLSGPFIAWLIIQGLPQPALVGLVIAGASDWLDGYVARRSGVDSIVGTYLDPLADKVLIGCVAVSMAHANYLPLELVILVVTRDAVLIGGSIMQRVHNMNWQFSSLRGFFNVADGLPKIKPLYISKVNTVFQLALVGTALIQPAFSIEDTYSVVPFLSWCVAFTTCASTIGYGWKLFGRKQFINM